MPDRKNFDVSAIPDQSSKTMLITGANNGLGLQSATELARAGARILLACRNPDKAATALERVCAASPAGADHRVIPLDLADLSSVRDAAERARDIAPVIDVLVNNAGLMAVPFSRTVDGFEMQLGTNHFGHFVLTDELLPSLLAAPAPRVVSLASVAHRRGNVDLSDLNYVHREYDRMDAYSQPKLANLLFSSELARRSERVGGHLTAVAAHPGIAATNLFDSMIPPIPGAATLTHLGLKIFGNDEKDGALSQLYAATMPDVRNDDYLGPNEFRGARGPVRRSPRSGDAKNADLASGLWDMSVALTGATYAGLSSA